MPKNELQTFKASSIDVGGFDRKQLKNYFDTIKLFTEFQESVKRINEKVNMFATHHFSEATDRSEIQQNLESAQNEAKKIDDDIAKSQSFMTEEQGYKYQYHENIKRLENDRDNELQTVIQNQIRNEKNIANENDQKQIAANDQRNETINKKANHVRTTIGIAYTIVFVLIWIGNTLKLQNQAQAINATARGVTDFAKRNAITAHADAIGNSSITWFMKAFFIGIIIWLIIRIPIKSICVMVISQSIKKQQINILQSNGKVFEKQQQDIHQKYETQIKQEKNLVEMTQDTLKNESELIEMYAQDKQEADNQVTIAENDYQQALKVYQTELEQNTDPRYDYLKVRLYSHQLFLADIATLIQKLTPNYRNQQSIDKLAELVEFDAPSNWSELMDKMRNIKQHDELIQNSKMQQNLLKVLHTDNEQIQQKMVSIANNQEKWLKKITEQGEQQLHTTNELNKVMNAINEQEIKQNEKLNEQNNLINEQTKQTRKFFALWMIEEMEFHDTFNSDYEYDNIFKHDTARDNMYKSLYNAKWEDSKYIKPYKKVKAL